MQTAIIPTVTSNVFHGNRDTKLQRSRKASIAPSGKPVRINPAMDSSLAVSTADSDAAAWTANDPFKSRSSASFVQSPAFCLLLHFLYERSLPFLRGETHTFSRGFQAGQFLGIIIRKKLRITFW